MNTKLKRHFILVPIIVAYGLVFLGGIVGYLLLYMAEESISDSSWLFLAENYGIFAGIWIVTLIYLSIMEKDILKNVFSGLKGNNLKMLLIGLLIGFVMNMVCAVVAMINKDIAISFSGIDIVYLLVAAVVVYIQSSAEELVCRGYMHMALRERYGIIIAALINSGLFALLHISNPGITWISIGEIFVIGLTLTVCVECLDSLWMAFAIHAAWNYTQNIILGLPNSGLVSEKAIFHLDAAKESIFYSIDFGLEGGITSIIVCALAGIILYVIARKRKNNNTNE